MHCATIAPVRETDSYLEDTRAAVFARLRGARMLDDLAPHSRESFGARAPKLVRCGVLASPAVHARLMRPAVVQI